MRGAVTGLNALYVYCLDETAWLAEQLGKRGRASELSALAERTRAAIRARCWDADRKVFVNCLREGRLSGRFGQHENFLALLFNIADAEQAAAIARRFLAGDAPLPVWPGKGTIGWFELARGDAPWEDENEPVPAGTPFFSYFIIRALFEAGRAGAALNYIREHWGGLLRRGATTTWEGWSDASSLSHAWSAAPASLLSEYVLGVVPLSPGFGSVGVYPCLGGLSSASGRVPTPHGAVEVELGTDAAGLELGVRAPEGMGVEAGLPVVEGKEIRIFVNGRKFEPSEQRLVRSIPMRVAVCLPA